MLLSSSQKRGLGLHRVPPFLLDGLHSFGHRPEGRYLADCLLLFNILSIVGDFSLHGFIIEVIFFSKVEGTCSQVLLNVQYAIFVGVNIMREARVLRREVQAVRCQRRKYVLASLSLLERDLTGPLIDLE